MWLFHLLFWTFLISTTNDVDQKSKFLFHNYYVNAEKVHVRVGSVSNNVQFFKTKWQMSKWNNLINNKVRHIYIFFATLNIKIWGDMFVKSLLDSKSHFDIKNIVVPWKLKAFQWLCLYFVHPSSRNSKHFKKISLAARIENKCLQKEAEIWTNKH